MKKYILFSALIYMTVLPAGHTRSMAIRRRVNIISKKKQDRYARNKPFIRSQGRLKRGKQDNKKDLKPAIFRVAVAFGAFLIIYHVLYPKPPPPPIATGTGMGAGMGGIPSGPGATSPGSDTDTPLSGAGSGSGGIGGALPGLTLTNDEFALTDDTLSKVADTKPIKIVNANPFTLAEPFKPFKVDWENSTLDKKATIKSMKDHADKLSDPLKNTKWVWPYYDERKRKPTCFSTYCYP